jgi:hypothetical protein
VETRCFKHPHTLEHPISVRRSLRRSLRDRFLKRSLPGYPVGDFCSNPMAWIQSDGIDPKGTPPGNTMYSAPTVNSHSVHSALRRRRRRTGSSEHCDHCGCSQLELEGEEEEEEEVEEEEEEYGGYGAEDDGTEDDGGDSLYAIWKSGSLSLTNLLSNSEVVSTVNERYEELKAIEPNSAEEKKLMAFMDDIRHFFKTGESELYTKDAIVGRWRFAPNVSLRENKKTRTTISVDEMRGIQATVGKMRRVTLQVWPEADQKQIRVNGLSVGGAFDDVLKKLRTLYQKAVDDGDIDDDAFGYGGGYSQPVGFEQAYGTQGEGGESQGKVDEVKRMLTWIQAKDPNWVPSQLNQSMLKGDSMRIGSGKWEGSGIRFQVTVKPDKVNLSKEAEFLAGSLKAGWPLRSGKLNTNIVKGRLHVRSGMDVFVFTRY